MRTLLAIAATALSVAVFTPAATEAAPLAGLSPSTVPVATVGVEPAHYYYRRRHCCHRYYSNGYYDYGYRDYGYRPYAFYGPPVFAFSFGGHRHHRHW